MAVGIDQIATGVTNIANGTQGPSVFEFGGYSAARGAGFSDGTSLTIGALTPVVLSLAFSLAPVGRGGFTLPGGAPRRLEASADEINTLFVRLLKTANSREFVSRARAMGYTDAQIAQVTDRIWQYWEAGQIGVIRSGGWASQDALLIGRSGMFSRSGRMRHELGHVLDEIANPGIMAASMDTAKFGWSGFARAEWVAFGTQYSHPVNLYLSRPWLAAFTTSHNRYGYWGSVPFVLATGAVLVTGEQYLLNWLFD